MALLLCAPMHISDFDFELPEQLIAAYPPAQRRDSRLLVVADELRDLTFSQFLSCLRAEDILVFNDTRVIKARLRGHKESGGRIEVLLERIVSERRALAHIRASKTPPVKSHLLFDRNVSAEVIGREAGLFILDFSADLLPFVDAHGEIPLPPYLKREATADDVERYQTVYAKVPGAVAAPTAGLHFDDAMMAESLALGVRHAWVTLHVGAGTFQSLRESAIAENKLHSERISVSEATCAAVKETHARGGRVIAIGTTTVRALESAARGGVLQPFSGETDIFIYPGFKFQIVDAMLTNFHLPQSSLLMLVAAFSGKERVLDAYRHAVQENYRFFSYGDAMFLHSSRFV